MGNPENDAHPKAMECDGAMISLAGGTFDMGSDRHYPEEGPRRRVHVDAFAIDITPVTNAQFAAFVDATGYETFAERVPNAADYPGILPAMLRAGSLAFSPPERPVAPDAVSAWWRFAFGADWRHPDGPTTSIDGLDDHPVVHVAYEDVVAFASWAGKSLPTEAEWEFAARGGLAGADYAWGDELEPGGRLMANYWHGAFPSQNLLLDGFARTSPVGCFPANGFGLYDMIGNVWEWTDDWFEARHAASGSAPKACCVPRNPRAGSRERSYDPSTPDIRIPRKVLKGGSHLCAPNYCRRYRPAARYPQPIDSSTSHVGFRCVVRDHDAAATTGACPAR